MNFVIPTAEKELIKRGFIKKNNLWIFSTSEGKMTLKESILPQKNRLTYDYSIEIEHIRVRLGIIHFVNQETFSRTMERTMKTFFTKLFPSTNETKHHLTAI